MLEKTKVRKVSIAALISIPILYSIGHAVFSPDFLIRAFDSDVSHDYFYNGLLILDGELPQGSQHPGTPYYYMMALLQYILAGSVKEAIKNASMILKIASIFGTILPLTLLYITGKSLIKHRLLFFTTSIFAIYSIPSTFYYTTQYGPDFMIPILTLVIGIILIEYLLGQGTVNEYLIGGLTGIGLSIKMSIFFAVPPILVALFIPSISNHRNDPMKIVSSDSFRQGIKYILSSALAFFILTLPDVRNYPRLLLYIGRKFFSLSESPDYGINNIIYIQQYLLVLVLFSCLLVVVYKNKNKIISEFPIQFWGYFITALLMFLISFSSPFGMGEVTPRLFSNASVPIISFIWITILLVDEVNITKQIPGTGKNFNILLSLLLVFFVISSASMALYNYQHVDKEYAIGAEANEIVSELEEVDGRVAINQRGPDTNGLGRVQSTYGPSVFFHFHGNERYAYEHFTPILTELYPNFTHVRSGYARSMFRDEGRDRATSLTHPSDLPRYLWDIYTQNTNTDPNPYSNAGLYGGAESNLEITCLIYSTESHFGRVTSGTNEYDVLATEAGFDNYTVNNITFSENREYITETEFVKICRES